MAVIHTALPTRSLYPSPSETALRLQHVGQNISDVQAPAVIIDEAVARRNCKLMLETASALGVGFRAHVKTHKTTQLTKLQVGEHSETIKLVVSTVAEAEHLLPWLLECRSAGKAISVLYGLPVSPSAVPRLATIAGQLGEGSIGLFVDHPSHIDLLDKVNASVWPGPITVFAKIDTGYHRAGVAAQSAQLADLADAIAASERVNLVGFYTHMGHSYGVSNPEEALQFLSKELQGLEEAAVAFLKCSGAKKSSIAGQITLSLGATPTTTAAQNLLHTDSAQIRGYRGLLDKIKRSFDIELHAGVYPVMDMQQLATRARPKTSSSNPERSLLSLSDLGLRTLVEVASLYGNREKPEALIAAGSIVLGREPCKSYPGWGVVTPWPAKEGPVYDPEDSKTGWIVGRVSQEHGILTWEGPANKFRKLELGEKLLIWPNHACIAGVNFGWYLVVDSDSDDPDIIRDVWVRWRGW